ncbi:alpha/beta fold hydrolase [Alkalihalobacillus sp. AL-G]|uniref:alpha/beta fold hydrolase n=1 Tax=Alkalihalobacillus sp. AL-G TaxID=2926399 RepID=UPI00272D3BDC|nr:alpha/beta hydrolase [Alkalihalobacillus sp. AL-G]WLD94372.1 alpha/beta hydrolase [Alkalihalobacillus sp. AL-G]
MVDKKERIERMNINGAQIHVKIIGEGEPIVFLHGGPGSEHRFFLPHVLPLAEKYKLVLYDQRGCGQSEPAPNGRYTMRDEVETLESIRRELGYEKINLFGESWGSMLALLYATTYPERVNKILLTAAVGASAEGVRVFGKELNRRLSLVDKLKVSTIQLGRKMGLASIESELNVLDPYYLFSKDALNSKHNKAINDTVNQSLGKDMMEKYDVTALLDRLANIPILIAQGSHDILTPERIKDLLLKHIPHAELVEVKNCGHWTVVEKPDEMNEYASNFFR